MWPEIFQDLFAAVAGMALFPVDACFREAEDVNVMRHHALADVFEVDEIVLCRDLVWIVKEKTHVAGGFGSERVSMVVIGSNRVGGSVRVRE